MPSTSQWRRFVHVDEESATLRPTTYSLPKGLTRKQSRPLLLRFRRAVKRYDLERRVAVFW